MVLAVPTNPLYRARVVGAFAKLACCRNDPCACSFVLITSSGQVTIPEAMPAAAPQKLLMLEVGSFVEKRAREDTGVFLMSEPPDSEGPLSRLSPSESDIFCMVLLSLRNHDRMFQCQLWLRCSLFLEVLLSGAKRAVEPQHRLEMSSYRFSHSMNDAVTAM